MIKPQDLQPPPDVWAVHFVGSEVRPVLYPDAKPAQEHAAIFDEPGRVRVQRYRLVPVRDDGAAL